ncbi:MAG: DUF547 domain-containing protein, partial [Planctomycetota bacterium]
KIFLAVTYYSTTGGPLLRNEPFTGKKLDKQLDEQSKKYASVLNNFVNDEGKVSYFRLRPKRLELIEILDILKNLDPKEYNKWTKEDKIAFWINAYNINMLKIIIDNYPIDSYRMFHVLPSWGPDSVRHIDKKIEGIKNQKFIIMEEEFTLDTIEQRYFRTEDIPGSNLLFHYRRPASKKRTIYWKKT